MDQKKKATSWAPWSQHNLQSWKFAIPIALKKYSEAQTNAPEKPLGCCSSMRFGITDCRTPRHQTATSSTHYHRRRWFKEKIGTPIKADLVAGPASGALFFMMLIVFLAHHLRHFRCEFHGSSSGLKLTTIASEMAFNRSTSCGSGFFRSRRIEDVTASSVSQRSVTCSKSRNGRDGQRFPSKFLIDERLPFEL